MTSILELISKNLQENVSQRLGYESAVRRCLISYPIIDTDKYVTVSNSVFREDLVGEITLVYDKIKEDAVLSLVKIENENFINELENALKGLNWRFRLGLNLVGVNRKKMLKKATKRIGHILKPTYLLMEAGDYYDVFDWNNDFQGLDINWKSERGAELEGGIEILPVVDMPQGVMYLLVEPQDLGQLNMRHDVHCHFEEYPLYNTVRFQFEEEIKPVINCPWGIVKIRFFKSRKELVKYYLKKLKHILFEKVDFDQLEP